MGRVLTITNSNSSRAGVRKKTIGREIVIGPNAIKFVAITIFAVLAIVYLTQSTAGANRSIKVRDLDAKKTDLELQKERLEVEQTRLKSLKEIDSTVAKTDQNQNANANTPEPNPNKNTLEPVANVEHTASVTGQ